MNHFIAQSTYKGNDNNGLSYSYNLSYVLIDIITKYFRNDYKILVTN